jgi:S-phase kinase-associated protein 1
MALSGKKVKLQPSDDDKAIVEVPIEAAHMSTTIKNMLDGIFFSTCHTIVLILIFLDLGEEASGIAIPLHNVTSKVLTKVVEYCTYHVENPVKSDDKKDDKNTADILPWDQKFCEVDQATLFELILAANYLDIKPLLDLTCKTVANMIKGKTPEEIRKTYAILSFRGKRERFHFTLLTF